MHYGGYINFFWLIWKDSGEKNSDEKNSNEEDSDEENNG